MRNFFCRATNIVQATTLKIGLTSYQRDISLQPMTINLTDIATSINRFGQSVCGLRGTRLRTKSRAADNRKINANFKKGGFVVYQTVALLMKCVQAKKNATEESGKNLYLFVAFFLTNSIASNPPFLKLRLSLMRYLQLYWDTANLKLYSF